jgi:hypothetical protein
MSDPRETARERFKGHTPGPWSVCGASAGRCGCGLIWCGARDYVVATATKEDDDHTIGDAEFHANAHLIAAAPDLLAEVAALTAEVAALTTKCAELLTRNENIHAAKEILVANLAAAEALGYKQAWTYTLPHEPGTSLRAAGFEDMGMTDDNANWGREGRQRPLPAVPGSTRRWRRILGRTPAGGAR